MGISFSFHNTGHIIEIPLSNQQSVLFYFNNDPHMVVR